MVLAGAGWAVYDDRHSFARAMDQMGPGPVALSLAFGLLAVSVSMPTWRDILRGLGATLPLAESAQVFYVSQLGKYLPGSVWPVLMQMEAGRRRGFSRRTMISANLILIAISCCIGISLACGVLPFYDSRALAHYWWALLVLPVLIGTLHPRALPAVLDRAFALAHRPPLDERLDPRFEARACGWVLISWAAYGAQLTVLVAALRPWGLSTFLLCTGAVSLAIPLGILFIPAPAGAGVREVVLTLVLSSVLDTGEALAVVVTARALVVVCDIGLAGVGAALGRVTGAGPSRSATKDEELIGPQ
jgi:uncharacterized membrane protein YbhN (UPF0104 family)